MSSLYRSNLLERSIKLLLERSIVNQLISELKEKKFDKNPQQ